MDFGKWLRVEWDRAVAVGCMVVGAVVLIVGWLDISRTPYPAEQLPYILSGGIGGVFLLGLGATCWLSADLRDEWSKLDSIDESLHELAGSSLVNGNALGNAMDNGYGNGHGDTTRAPATYQAPAQPAYAPPRPAEPELPLEEDGSYVEHEPTDPGYAMATAPTRRQRPLRASDAGVVRRRLADGSDGAQ
jgi:hypothetical protein